MKNNTKVLLLLITSFIVWSFSAQAQTSTIPSENPSLMKGTRPLGMGNAFIAMPGSDENAPFYNPAAINDYEKKLHFRILSPAFDFSPGTISLIKDVFQLSKDINAESTDGGKTRVFRNFVNTHSGEFQSAQVRLPLVTVMHKWFSASILTDSRNTISFRNRAFTNVEILSQSDVGGTFGGAYGFFDDQLQAGLNLKILHRVSINETITIDKIINSTTFKDTVPILRATGVGFDIGLKGKIPTFEKAWLDLLKPTVGFTWQDVGNTRFSGNVPNTQQSISLGLAVHPQWGKWQFHVANDFRELNQSNNFLNKWNIGAEVVAPRLWGFFTPSARIGGHQAYISAGAGLDFKYAKLEFATYGEEAGKFSHSKQLRRIAGNLSFGF